MSQHSLTPTALQPYTDELSIRYSYSGDYACGGELDADEEPVDGWCPFEDVGEVSVFVSGTGSGSGSEPVPVSALRLYPSEEGQPPDLSRPPVPFPLDFGEVNVGESDPAKVSRSIHVVPGGLSEGEAEQVRYSIPPPRSLGGHD